MLTPTPVSGLQRDRRITRSDEIRMVLREGRRFGGDLVSGSWVARPGPTRVAFVAGRRTGRAVARNRARRLMKESWSQLGVRPGEGADVVFVAQPQIRGVGMAEVGTEMDRIVARIERALA